MKTATFPSWRERLSKHDYRIEGPLTHPFESIQLGNGDIGASVNIYPHEIRITLAKSDIWDSRCDGKPEETVFKQDDLIRKTKEEGRALRNFYEKYSGEGHAETLNLISDKWYDEVELSNFNDYIFESEAMLMGPVTRGPSPKRAGCIRLYHPGLSNTRVTTHVSLADGLLTSKFIFAHGELIVKAFLERGNSRVWVNVESSGEAPWFVFIVEKEPDETDPDIPHPVISMEGESVGALSQTIPAGLGIEEFTWAIAAKFPLGVSGIETHFIEQWAWRFRQFCNLKPGCSATLCVSIATDRDGEGDTCKRAVELATEKESFEQVFAEHQVKWAKFWDASCIELDDEELEATWYRNHFSYGCSLSSGMTPLGSGGNVVVSDTTRWHGDYHMNHNFQKWYCTALPTNHPEWIDIYADFIENTMPVFEYHARLIYDLEGVHCDLSYWPFMSKEHSSINNWTGRALALTGWLGQQLWWHWEYMRDKKWLKERGYPYLKKAAQFYYNYMQKYMDESGDIYPSVRLEEPAWSKDFRGNRNVISDLCMFKKTFDRAISAAEVLGIDEDWQKKWGEARLHVPDIDHGIDENGEGWVALDKFWRERKPKMRADLARHIRWGGGGWIVYPGEYVPGDGNDSLTEALRDMVRRTNLLDPFTLESTGDKLYPGTPIIHPISSIIPAIRLGVKEHFEQIREVILEHRLTYGQTSSYVLANGEIPKEVMGYGGFLWYDWRSVENKYLGVLATTEMLLQSQEGVIRLFPFWPDGRNAAFKTFRAVGGFVVSAKREQGKITALIESTAGEPVRLRWNGALRVICDGEEVSVEQNSGIYIFETHIGKFYECCD